MSEVLEAAKPVKESNVETTPSNITVDSNTSETVKDLLAKLSWLIKCIEKNPGIPVLENFLFSNGAIIAYDFQIAAMQLTTIKGFFLLPARKLLSILKSLEKADVVSFAYQPESTIEIIVNGESIYRLNVEDPITFPKINKCEIVIGEFPDTLDIDQLSMASKYTSTDSLRVPMLHVKMDNKNIVATNGHWMFFKAVKSIQVYDEPFNIMFRRKTIELISSFKHATVKRTTEHTHIMIKEKERAVVFRNCDEVFPDFKSVLPDEGNIKFSIDKKKLLHTLTLALLAANRVTHQGILTLVHGSHELRLCSTDLDFGEEFSKSLWMNSIDWKPEACKEYMPDPSGAKIGDTDIIRTITVDSFKPLAAGDKFQIGFNIKWLLEIVKDIALEKIKFEMSKPNKAIILNDDILLMPSMIPEELLDQGV